MVGSGRFGMSAGQPATAAGVRSSRPHVPGNKKSFVLVVTVSLLVLLMLVAVGMLGLSAVSIRSSGLEMARSAAMANARLALQLAIGELQKELGPDQRISAAARIIEPDDSAAFAHPVWLGSWNSWDNWLNGNIKLNNRTLAIKDTYTAGRKSHFRRWLVSQPGAASLAALEDARTYGSSADLVELVGEGTLGAGNGTSASADNLARLHVKAPKVGLDSGAFAWWVGGENQKTRIAAAKDPATGAAQIHRLSQWPGGGERQLDGLASLPGLRDQLDKLVSLSTLEVTSPDRAVRDGVRGRFHDLTTDSLGVLANVRRGGLKQDLNLLLENDRLPVEFGTYRRDNQNGSRIPIRPNTPDVPQAYWNSSRVSPGKPNFTVWYKLHQYYGLYRGEDGPGDELAGECDPLAYHRGLWGTGSPNVNFYWSSCNALGYYRMAMVSRLMMVLSTRRVADPNAPGKYSCKLSINPVVTIWNPYNATLYSPRLAVRLYPRNIEYKAYKNGAQLFDWKQMRVTGNNAEDVSLDVCLRESAQADSPIILKPGQTRIYSALKDAATFGNQDSVEAYPGYLPPDQGGGLDVPIDAGLSGLWGSDNVELALRLSDRRASGEGSNHQFYFVVRNYKRDGDRMLELAGNPIPDGMSMTVIPDESGKRVKMLQSDQRSPFASIEFVMKNGEKLVNPPVKDANGAELPPVEYRCRSFIHANPVNSQHCYGEATDRAKAMDEWFVYVATGAGNSLNPDFDPASNRSYLGSALSAGSGSWPGQLQAITTELPAVAVTSIASLMHFKLSPGVVCGDPPNHGWDISPNQMLAIGNSFAHPLIPAAAVYQDVPDLAERYQWPQFCMERDVYDLAFFNNDALWDDWFCSTITRQNQGVFKDSRNLGQVVREFIAGITPLPNSHLQPWPGSLDAKKLEQTLVMNGSPAMDAWKLAASRLVLEGAFNVNSTSVDAWKALLWGLQDKSILCLDPGSGQIREQSLPTGRVILSRFSLPCSAAEGQNPGDPNSWLGIRMLTAEQVDKLASECVRQVKLRGPFLNLAEFVNRRLQTGNLGRCGALQAAIDWDDFTPGSPAANAKDSINARFKDGDDRIPLNAVQYTRDPRLFNSNPALPFPEAGTGSRYAGIPGYVTQADVLKRIGNMITTRDDTFRIRAYGETRGKSGEVTARAWCEAVVQRIPEYLDSADPSRTPVASLKSAVNKTFGRRIRLVSFRWLAADEI